jgi:Ca2+-binding EF-hand superfamily protein
MLSHFQRRKLNHLFDMYDADRNGFLEQSDYEQMAKNHAEISGFALDSPQLAHVHALNTELWNSVRQFSSDRDRKHVTREEFVAAYEPLLGDRATFVARIGDLADAIIALGDRDGDGRLSWKEYGDNLRAFDMRLTEAEGIDIARRLDMDGDGHLTRAEISKLLEEFFYSDDPAALGNELLGKY